MKNSKHILLLLILLTSQTTYVSGLTQADYHQKFWGGGLNIWLNYPEDASPGETFKVNIYILSSKFARGNQVEEVKVKITCLTSSSTQVLYDNTLMSYVYMQNGETLNTSIPITLPKDARWYMTIMIDTVSYQQDYSNRQEAHVILDSTQIRTTTYNDLEKQKLELQAYIIQLDQKYSELLDKVNTIQTTPDSQLEQDYLDLVEEYLLLTDMYNQLSSSDMTGTGDLVDAVHELEAMNQQLMENAETFTTQLAEKEIEINEIISNFSEERQALITEINEATADKQAITSEYQEYKETHDVTNETFETLTTQLNQSIVIRNSLAVITIISIAAAAALYMRRN